jgi:hypothetical protein
VKRGKQFEKAAESEVWNAITAFQEILNAIPGDRTALETLFEAYDHLGDRNKALQYLMQLAEQVNGESDPDILKWVHQSLHRLGQGVDQAQQLADQIERSLVDLGVSDSGQRAGRMSSAKKDIEGEMELAWRLLQAEEITQEEYSVIAQDLSENSTKNVEVPVTVLHVLHDRTFKNMQRILVFLSRESGAPLIALSDFELNRAAVTLLPGVFRLDKGALPFELIGEEVMVAVLNPCNEALQRQVEQTVGRPCHFYLVEASDYDAALTRVQQMLQMAHM